jgi:hypothetical protein
LLIRVNYVFFCRLLNNEFDVSQLSGNSSVASATLIKIGGKQNAARLAVEVMNDEKRKAAANIFDLLHIKLLENFEVCEEKG